MLKYYIIILFQNSSILLPLFPESLAIVLKLCLFHNWENTSNLKRNKHPPTGVCLSPLFILTAVTDGQNVTVLMLVTVDLLL